MRIWHGESDGQQGTFKPRRSLGWLWTACLAVLVVLGGWPAGGGIRVAGTVLALLILAVVVFFPAMRYAVDGDEVRLVYGPLLTYRIRRSEIVAISRADLTPTLWAALRLPGLALYTVRYAGTGAIRMCSTRAAHGVLVIETGDGRRYGVSPREEERFVAAASGEPHG
ncbi:PH domain-containing protein [Streptomyces sp. NPDC059863]|uniref:PH domain-containing protein n=1 Tax=unclassified Streptomyces TaxID=2593676 RepID=UPI003648229C